MNKKIVIVGAGPIGCYTAQLLKNYGYSPLLIEEHGEVGRPLHCTGLVGNNVFAQKWPFKISFSSVLNTINGAVIHLDNQHFAIERKKVAFVIDRERFDKDLSQGLNILYESKFLGLEKTNSHYLIETEHDEILADMVIGADGANSTMRKIVSDNGSVRQCRGVQLRMKTKPKFKDMVEMHLKKGFFVWIVPEREDVVRIGTISDNPYKDLQDFLRENKLKGQILEKFGGLVCSGICNNTTKDNLALVGDAACQLKPLTYGGVYYGLKASTILAHCIKEHRLPDYDSLWRRELVFEIKVGLKIKEVYNRLNKDELNALFRILKSQKLLIERIGDFENHSHLFLEIIKKPKLYPQISDLFRIFFKTIF